MFILTINFVEYEGHLYLMDNHGERLIVDNMKENVKLVHDFSK